MVLESFYFFKTKMNTAQSLLLPKNNLKFLRVKSKLFVQKIDHQRLKVVFLTLCHETGEVKPQR